LAESAVALRALFVVFPVLGAGLIWLLKAAAGWVASLAWTPFHGLFKLIASIPEPQATLGALGIGALLGLVVAWVPGRRASRSPSPPTGFCWSAVDPARRSSARRLPTCSSTARSWYCSTRTVPNWPERTTT
jgi:hypothetical protein